MAASFTKNASTLLRVTFIDGGALLVRRASAPTSSFCGETVVKQLCEVVRVGVDKYFTREMERELLGIICLGSGPISS